MRMFSVCNVFGAKGSREKGVSGSPLKGIKWVQRAPPGTKNQGGHVKRGPLSNILKFGQATSHHVMPKSQGPKRTAKPKNHTNSTKRLSEQVEGTT